MAPQTLFDPHPEINHTANSEQPAPTTTSVSYVSRSGHHVQADDLVKLATFLRDDAEFLKEWADRVRHRTAAERAEMLLDLLEDIEPNLEACPPSPPTVDELAAAQGLLARAVGDAQALVVTEARHQHMTAMRKEAFVLPGALLVAILEAVKPDFTEGEYETAQRGVEAYGWEVDSHVTNSAYITNRGEPFRKLRDLMEALPRHHLTSQAMEVIDLALAWAKGASPSPCGDGAPEAVKYPFIRVELLPFPELRAVPKGYRERTSVLMAAGETSPAGGWTPQASQAASGRPVTEVRS